MPPRGQKSHKSEQIEQMLLKKTFLKDLIIIWDIFSEAALKYLLEQKGFNVERQVYLPIYWDDVRLDQDYRMDLVINGNIIVELKEVKYIETPHRRQLWNYLNLTHLPYGILIYFSPKGLYSEWYHRHQNGEMEQIKIRKE